MWRPATFPLRGRFEILSGRCRAPRRRRPSCHRQRRHSHGPAGPRRRRPVRRCWPPPCPVARRSAARPFRTPLRAKPGLAAAAPRLLGRRVCSIVWLTSISVYLLRCVAEGGCRPSQQARDYSRRSRPGHKHLVRVFEAECLGQLPPLVGTGVGAAGIIWVGVFGHGVVRALERRGAGGRRASAPPRPSSASPNACVEPRAPPLVSAADE